MDSMVIYLGSDSLSGRGCEPIRMATLSHQRLALVLALLLAASSLAQDASPGPSDSPSPSSPSNSSSVKCFANDRGNGPKNIPCWFPFKYLDDPYLACTPVDNDGSLWCVKYIIYIFTFIMVISFDGHWMVASVLRQPSFLPRRFRVFSLGAFLFLFLFLVLFSLSFTHLCNCGL